MKPLIYVKRVHVPLEEQFKYLSDESSDSSDEEWTLGPKKKKKDKEPKSAGMQSKKYVRRVSVFSHFRTESPAEILSKDF